MAANNLASTLKQLKRFKEAKSLLRKTIPVGRRVLGDSHEFIFRMRSIYAETLYGDPDATLSDLKEAVTTLEELARAGRRVFGTAHPTTEGLEAHFQMARAALSSCA